MNKEQVEKHGNVIQWYIHNQEKGVWWKTPIGNTWCITTDPSFGEEYKYVQNDEYAELRKAIIDGKNVECVIDRCYDEWKVIEKQPTDDFYPAFKYRIQPNKSKFKVGDWVKDISSGAIIQAYEDMIEDNFVKWTPDYKELCVFWDKNTDEYFIGKYGTEALSSTYWFNHGGTMYTKEDWSNVAPLEYIQTLKDNA